MQTKAACWQEIWSDFYLGDKFVSVQTIYGCEFIYIWQEIMHQSDVLSHRHAVLMGVNSCSETYNCENFLKSMVFLSRLHWNTGIISFDLFRSSSGAGPRRLCSPPALLARLLSWAHSSSWPAAGAVILLRPLSPCGC